MVNPCCYGGPLCMMSVRDISFFIMSPVMLFIWLTICNKKGTVRDLCTIPLHQLYITLSSKRYLPPLTTTLFCGTASATSFAIDILRICCLIYHVNLLCYCIMVYGSDLYRDTAVTSIAFKFMLCNFIHFIVISS
mgnify:CR=1 FL=1